MFWQPETFPYKEDLMSTNNICLVLAVLVFIGCILAFKVNVEVSVKFYTRGSGTISSTLARQRDILQYGYTEYLTMCAHKFSMGCN